MDIGRKLSVVGQIFTGVAGGVGLFVFCMLIGSLSAPTNLPLADSRGFWLFGILSLLMIGLNRKYPLRCYAYALSAILAVAFWFFVQGIAGG